MPRKKTPAQLKREIDEVLQHRAMRASGRTQSIQTPVQPRHVGKASTFPTLRVTAIYPEYVDEWYGVRVNFQWARPLDMTAYRQMAQAEEEDWFRSHPGRMHVGPFPLEKAMGEHIGREITRSPQWTEFFSKSRIPRFTAQGIDNWNFDEQGGTASAGTRDED